LNPAVIPLVTRADLIESSEPGGKGCRLAATQEPTGRPMKSDGSGKPVTLCKDVRNTSNAL
jgi:hypothetical protein